MRPIYAFFLTTTVTLLSLFPLSTLAQEPFGACIPMPNHITAKSGKPFCVDAKTVILAQGRQLEFEVAYLQRVFKNRMATALPLQAQSTRSTNRIRLVLDASVAHSQGYTLTVDAQEIVITASTPTGVLYGVLTLDQLLLGDEASTQEKSIRPCSIQDAPRFERRALMLDPARHFLPVADVKFYMDQMLKYKYNVLQLHLSDDQGWRMEIIGHEPLTASGPYYTQAELKELVAYGQERHIEIVPEFDIPGHTVAVLAAYPHLGCSVSDTIPKIVGETVNLMLCSNEPQVYTLFQTVLHQVAAIFPSPYIHLGGDEAVVDKNWALCEHCAALMKEKHYTKASDLMIPFFDKMLGFVRDEGKKAILWCELDNIRMPASEYLFPYPQDVILVTWRNGLTPTCLNLTAKHGHQILMAPGEYAYFDYPQLKGDLPEFHNWGMPVTTLRKSYEFDPGYGLPAPQQQHIWGVMGTLWGEAILDINRATYMTFPRAFALAEAGWTQMEHRSWDSFKQRLYPNLLDLIKCGVSVRAPFEIVER